MSHEQYVGLALEYCAIIPDEVQVVGIRNRVEPNVHSPVSQRLQTYPDLRAENSRAGAARLRLLTS